MSKKAVKPLAEAYEKQNLFITNASHELKTPLTIISANNEMLEIENGENEYSQAINKQINKMNSMVKNLTMLSRIYESTNIFYENVDLSEVMLEIVNLYKIPFKNKNINFNYTINNDIIIKGDIMMLKQLFASLFDNALKYTKDDFELSLVKQSNKIVCTFTNNSYDIKKGNLDKCFERFYRLEEVRGSMIEGSGIGLSLAKEITYLHKGTIEAFAPEDNIFTIKLVF